jgi:predicted membrane channel-forming protein YqfA (hemolysin III family)
MRTIPFNRKAGNEGSRLFAVMNAIAWLVLGVGVLMCLFNLSDFTDENLGLMAGIGCLIASVHIYVIGTVIQLLQNDAKRRSPE